MFLDHPSITATSARTEPDRIERMQRRGTMRGYAMAMAGSAGDAAFVEKLTQLHAHKGTQIVFRHAPPTREEQDCFARAWGSKVGDGSSLVEHEF